MLAEIRRLWPAGFVDACTCEACQLGFAWPLVAGDAAFYSLLHERAGYPRERWEFARAREQFAGTTGRALDIGAGRGDFLESLPASLDKHAVEASRALCGELTQRGIHAHGDLPAAAAAGPYTLVTMFHVLQYFADPVAAIAQCGTMLATAAEGGGYLLISLPNAAAASAIDFLPAPPHPLTRWTPTAAKRAVTAAGLTVDRLEWIPQPLSSLLWAANSHTRTQAAARPQSLAGRVDALRPGRRRTALLASLALLALPSVLRHARRRLRQSQCLLVVRR